jgi:hypothetical protein
MKQKLPYETAALILGLVAFVGCCCFYGIGGIIFSTIGLVLAIQSEKTYKANPDIYELGRIPTWKIINIIALILSIINLAASIYLIATGKYEEILMQFQEMLEEMQANK